MQQISRCILSHTELDSYLRALKGWFWKLEIRKLRHEKKQNEEIYQAGYLGTERVNGTGPLSANGEGMIQLFSLCFLAFKHAATIMCEYRFVIKSMFLSCATQRINKRTLQQQQLF